MDLEEYPLWDVRVDESEHPIDELFRMQRVLEASLVSQLRVMPKRASPRGLMKPPSREGLA